MLPTQVCLVKAMVFPVVMYGCESWTIKKAECWRIDAFELWCWRRFLRVSWTARRSNQSILKQINPECSLGGQILKLKLQYFGYLMQRADSLEKTLILGKIEGRRRRGQQRMEWLDSIIDSMDMSPGKLQELVIGKPGMLWFMRWQRVRQDWATELNWTLLLSCKVMCNSFATPWTVAHQVPLSVGFCRQEYWSGLSFPSLGDLPDSGIKPEFFALLVDPLPLSHWGIDMVVKRALTLNESYLFFIYIYYRNIKTRKVIKRIERYKNPL